MTMGPEPRIRIFEMSVRFGIMLSHGCYVLLVLEPLYLSFSHQDPEQAVAQIILRAASVVALQPQTLSNFIISYSALVGLCCFKYRAFQMVESDLSLLHHAGRNNHTATSTERRPGRHYRICKETAAIFRSKCADQFRFNPQRFGFR